MLQRLSVDNYALIEHLEMQLDGSLNIVTGETGAGKSILLGALALLLGSRSDGAALLDQTRNCVVEGEFDIEGLGLEELFERNDLDYERHTVIRRIMSPSGKSRAFVNDMPVQLAQLKELGLRLIDIHSQHANPVLSSEEFRLRALDTAAGCGALADEYSAAYSRLCSLRRELAALEAEAEAAGRDEEWLRFRTDELCAAELAEGELERLEAEQAVLADADRIGETLAGVCNAFDREETGILSQLSGAETSLSHIRDSYPAASQAIERVRTALLDLKDLGSALASDAERIEADPERLRKIDDRISALYDLMRKYRVSSVGELICLRDEGLARLAALDNSDERRIEAQKEVAAAEKHAAALAERLHRARVAAAPGFSAEIVAILSRLGMAGARFEVSVADAGTLLASGSDRVEFMFTANAGTSPQPVGRIASGGEMSRVMLAVKAVLARGMNLPTIIFDEIDTGVSGRIADAMGEIINSLAGKMQVVDITHLPQVACKGSTHFVVSKSGGRTGIRRLDREERVTEIAKMLSGSEITDAALEQARILLGSR
ncbi:MAG: DNA repair protein RecN [Alistipes sp.]|nr:DNA repair protein RecN [Alistipes sp.]